MVADLPGPALSVVYASLEPQSRVRLACACRHLQTAFLAFQRNTSPGLALSPDAWRHHALHFPSLAAGAWRNSLHAAAHAAASPSQAPPPPPPPPSTPSSSPRASRPSRAVQYGRLFQPLTDVLAVTHTLACDGRLCALADAQALVLAAHNPPRDAPAAAAAAQGGGCEVPGGHVMQEDPGLGQAPGLPLSDPASLPAGRCLWLAPETPTAAHLPPAAWPQHPVYAPPLLPPPPPPLLSCTPADAGQPGGGGGAATLEPPLAARQPAAGAGAGARPGSCTECAGAAWSLAPGAGARGRQPAAGVTAAEQRASTAASAAGQERGRGRHWDDAAGECGVAAEAGRCGGCGGARDAAGLCVPGCGGGVLVLPGHPASAACTAQALALLASYAARPSPSEEPTDPSRGSQPPQHPSRHLTFLDASQHPSLAPPGHLASRLAALELRLPPPPPHAPDTVPHRPAQHATQRAQLQHRAGPLSGTSRLAAGGMHAGGGGARGGGGQGPASAPMPLQQQPATTHGSVLELLLRRQGAGLRHLLAAGSGVGPRELRWLGTEGGCPHLMSLDLSGAGPDAARGSGPPAADAPPAARPEPALRRPSRSAQQAELQAEAGAFGPALRSALGRLTSLQVLRLRDLDLSSVFPGSQATAPQQPPPPSRSAPPPRPPPSAGPPPLAGPPADPPDWVRPMGPTLANLRHLDLEGARGLGPDTLAAVLRAATRLTHLGLARCRGLALPAPYTPPYTLATAAAAAPPPAHLRSLTAGWGFDAPSVRRLCSASAASMTRLTLGVGAAVTDAGLGAVAAACPHLQELRLELCGVSGAGLGALLAACAKVHVLHVLGCTGPFAREALLAPLGWLGAAGAGAGAAGGRAATSEGAERSGGSGGGGQGAGSAPAAAPPVTVRPVTRWALSDLRLAGGPFELTDADLMALLAGRRAPDGTPDGATGHRPMGHRLRTLSLVGLPYLTRRALEHLAEHCTAVEHVRLERCGHGVGAGVGGGAGAAAGHAPGGAVPVVGAGSRRGGGGARPGGAAAPMDAAALLAWLERCGSLANLRLRHCCKLPVDAVERLAACCPRLEALLLDGCDLPPEGFALTPAPHATLGRVMIARCQADSMRNLGLGQPGCADQEGSSKAGAGGVAGGAREEPWYLPVEKYVRVIRLQDGKVTKLAL